MLFRYNSQETTDRCHPYITVNFVLSSMLLQMLPQCYTTKNSLHDAWKSNIITTANNTAKRKANQRLKDTKQYTLKYMQYFTLVQTKYKQPRKLLLLQQKFNWTLLWTNLIHWGKCAISWWLFENMPNFNDSITDRAWNIHGNLTCSNWQNAFQFSYIENLSSLVCEFSVKLHIFKNPPWSVACSEWQSLYRNTTVRPFYGYCESQCCLFNTRNVFISFLRLFLSLYFIHCLFRLFTSTFITCYIRYQSINQPALAIISS